jgi:adenosylhomocysteinase
MILMKDGAILANAGHFDVEIDVKGLERNALSKKKIRPLFDEYLIKLKHQKKRIFLCGEGRLVNLACAEGHPSSIMDLSFCNQALAVEYAYEMFKKGKRLDIKVHNLPDSIDKKIARIYLRANNIKIDNLTKEQEIYLKSWNYGT